MMKRVAMLVLLLMLSRAGPVLAQTAFDPFGAAKIDGRSGAQVPVDRTFLDENGNPVTLRDLADGKPLLLVPVQHRCPNLCGVTLAGVRDAIAAQKLLPGQDFVTVAFGIDSREGPTAAQADLDALGQRGPGGRPSGIHALTGTAEAIRAVTDAIGYHYAWDERIGQYAHAAGTAVLTPKGRLSGWLYGIAPSPDELERALRSAREEQPVRWSEALLLLCYHYDPVTGRYTLAVQRILKAAAALTVAVLGLYIVQQWRRRA